MAITRMVARPRLTALTMLVLMARMGHRPRIWTTPGVLLPDAVPGDLAIGLKVHGGAPSERAAAGGGEQAVLVVGGVAGGAATALVTARALMVAPVW
jgi:hypothetical protein